MIRRSVAVIGNGAGGCAAAASAAREGMDVRLYGRNAAKVNAFAEYSVLTLVEGENRYQTEGIVHTTDLDQAVTGADLVIIMVPTSAVPTYAAALAPHLDPSKPVLLAPGHTGGALAFLHAVSQVNPTLQDLTVAETFTLPFVTRMTGVAEVTVWRRMQNLVTGVLPASKTSDVLDLFIPVFPNIVPAQSVLESSLSNLNAIMHPPGMLGNVGWIEHSGGDFRFYAEGVTPGIGKMMERLDAERLAVANRFGLELPTFVDLFRSAGLAGEDLSQDADAYTAVRESVPNREIRSPSTLTDRYVAEDVGCGLVALTAFADVASVEMPFTQALITVADVINGADYRRSGLNAEKLGIIGLNRNGLKARVE